ncbi:hypothetical protein D3C72_2055550 [compost metagenome]
MLIQLDFLVRHVVQAVAAEEPQQVARDQVSDLRVAVEHLDDQFLALGHGVFGLARQLGQQLVEALEKQRVVLFRHLFSVAQGGQDGAQMDEQGKVMVDVGGGHGRIRQ